MCQLAEGGVHHELEVFDTPDGRGLGLRTAKGCQIKRHEILLHYAGEIITSKESKERDQKYSQDGIIGSYMLNQDEKGEYVIDGTHCRSVAALINHSCSEPNCELFRSLGNHLDSNFPFLALRAKEEIGELTELTFNYVRGTRGEKPVGLCDECSRKHCLCRQCKLAHCKKDSIES